MAIQTPTQTRNNLKAEIVRRGWKFICIGEPTWILTSALRRKAEEAREA